MVPEGAWLHAFLDRSSPRPGTADLFFSEAPTQEPVIPPPVVIWDENTVLIPLDVILFVVLVGLGVWRLVARRRSRQAGPGASGGG
jgi:hypothetical protein